MLALLARVPRITVGTPVLLTVSSGAILRGVAVCTPPREVLVSGLPAQCAGAAVDVLSRAYPRLHGVVGPRPEAEGFARSWSARTGVSAHERVAQRAFTLHRLIPPGGVRGAARRAGVSDLELLSRWRSG